MSASHLDPFYRSPVPQFPTYPSTALSPPPKIHVSMAEQQVRVVVPENNPERTLAEQEKVDYYARTVTLSTVRPKNNVGAVPAPIVVPPKAAFAQQHDSPLQSPVSLQQAQAFGDVRSYRTGESESGNGTERERLVDWSRYSVLARASEKDDKSEWLMREQGTSRKWYWIGIIGMVVLVATIVGIVVGLKDHSSSTGDGNPKVPDLGATAFNSKSTPSGTSVERTISTTVPVRTSTSSAVAPVLMTSASSSDTREVEISSVVTTTSPMTTSTLGSSRSSTTTSESRSSSVVNTTRMTSATASTASPTRDSTDRTTSPPSKASLSSSSSSTEMVHATSSSSNRVHRRFLTHASFRALRLDFVPEVIG
ncbi:uncharacterized protein JCM15063_003749 [Sporobolomyces koalae]|uniref:uncharacterized protein n=1 Tax=Sporobolomyces koalae TaxID=500713 RepID=UPI00317D4718